MDSLLASGERAGYRRALGPLSLTGIGIAAIIGAGIFVLLGQVARDVSGPAVILSIGLGGVAAILSALTFAELASFVPGSGSVYGYASAALGRLPAFLMGWFVLLAYAVGNMTVAVGWSEYFVSGMSALGWAIPSALASPVGEGGLLNLPAALIMLIVTFWTLRGVEEGATFNNLLVGVKIAVVLLVIGVGAFFVRPANWVPFSPGGTEGIFVGGAVLLFAYLGFDTVAAAGSEARRPQRDVPIAILLSIGVCTVLYVAMGAVLTGMQPSSTLEARAPVAEAFRQAGQGWASGVIVVGALVAMTTVLFAFHYALARILHAMAVDGFLPDRFGRLNPRTRIPRQVSLWAGGLTAAGAGIFPLRSVADMTVVSSVAIYVLVAVGVLALKRLEPDRPRPFRIHWSVAVAAILVMVGIVGVGIGLRIHMAFFVWVGAGLALYGFYGHRRALVRTRGAPTD